MNIKDQLNITYVCSGNTCRSYMAEAITKHLLKTVYLKNQDDLLDKINILSAGTFTILKSVPKSSKDALARLDIPAIDSDPTQISSNQLRYSDLVLTMADRHRSNIIKNYRNIDQEKIFTLLEMANIILYLESEKIYRRKPKHDMQPRETKTLQDLKNKIHVLKNINREVLLTTNKLDIQDPFGRSSATYLQVAKKIKDNIIIVFNYLFDTKINREEQKH
ncbi:MAG: hypothetical protein U5N58_03070 [Actinomycetota bacterium]|nr:hypothetical protein [Actinomycetota bacterium]